MSAKRVRYGKAVPLLVDAKGFQDGRVVIFEIWKETAGKKEKLDELNGTVRREKGLANWEPKFRRESKIALKEKISPNPQKVQYTFTAIIDKGTSSEKKVQGTPIEFTFPISIYIQDESGNPIDNAECTITFSDGSSKKDTVKNGILKVDAPSGEFEIKLDDYEFVF